MLMLASVSCWISSLVRGRIFAPEICKSLLQGFKKGGSICTCIGVDWWTGKTQADMRKKKS